MADTRVPLRTSNVLDKIAAARAVRLDDLREHAYRIDPGMRLARRHRAGYYDDDVGAVIGVIDQIDVTSAGLVVSGAITAPTGSTAPSRTGRHRTRPATTRGAGSVAIGQQPPPQPARAAEIDPRTVIPLILGGPPPAFPPPAPESRAELGPWTG
jgi:hypothetical protein